MGRKKNIARAKGDGLGEILRGEGMGGHGEEEWIYIGKMVRHRERCKDKRL